jgi:hypothetical protein
MMGVNKREHWKLHKAAQLFCSAMLLTGSYIKELLRDVSL